MDALSSAVSNNASSAKLGTVQGAAAVSVLKKAMDIQSASALQLIQALPQLPLARTGSLGTRLNALA